MHFAGAYSHHNGRHRWRERELDEWMTDIFERPNVPVGPGTTTSIRDHVKSEFALEGWAYDVKIDPRLDLTIFGLKDDLAFQLQTGNVSRAAYDLLKLQHLFAAQRIEAAALALPTKDAAQRIGSNIASFERIKHEIAVLDQTVTVPIFLIAFE